MNRLRLTINPSPAAHGQVIFFIIVIHKAAPLPLVPIILPGQETHGVVMIMLGTAIHSRFLDQAVHGIPFKLAAGMVFIDQFTQQPPGVISKLQGCAGVVAVDDASPEVVGQSNVLTVHRFLFLIQHLNAHQPARLPQESYSTVQTIWRILSVRVSSRMM